MIPQLHNIQSSATHELLVQLRGGEAKFRFSYEDLYDLYEEAVFYASNSVSDVAMLTAFKAINPKEPGDSSLLMNDFISLGNTLYVYGIIG